MCLYAFHITQPFEMSGNSKEYCTRQWTLKPIRRLITKQQSDSTSCYTCFLSGSRVKGLIAVKKTPVRLWRKYAHEPLLHTASLHTPNKITAPYILFFTDSCFDYSSEITDSVPSNRRLSPVIIIRCFISKYLNCTLQRNITYITYSNDLQVNSQLFLKYPKRSIIGVPLALLKYPITILRNTAFRRTAQFCFIRRVLIS